MFTCDSIRETLDRLCIEIKTAQSLDELLSALEAVAFAALDHENEMLARGVDMTSLPTFGGKPPADTTGIWSWSDSRILVGDCIGEMQIIAREAA